MRKSKERIKIESELKKVIEHLEDAAKRAFTMERELDNLQMKREIYENLLINENEEEK